MLRDFMLPVTSSTRSTEAQQGFPLTDFKQLTDDTITGKAGVHGVRETFQYTFPGGASNTFDEDVLTNADQTVVYLLMVHCDEHLLHAKPERHQHGHDVIHRREPHMKKSQWPADAGTHL